jgi:hypothetical protein
VVLLFDTTIAKGYMSPAIMGTGDSFDLLTTDGEHQAIPSPAIKAIYFVTDLDQPYLPERKAFLSRPKIEGLWLKLTFRDGDILEGVAPNQLLDVLDGGVQLTPADLHGNCLRIFIPRPAITEAKVLGVVGASKRPSRPSAPPPDQPTLFNE